MGEDRVTIRFASRRVSVTIYDPTIGTEPVRSLSGVESIEVALGDHPIVVAISNTN
jgi:hypothetical protein